MHLLSVTDRKMTVEYDNSYFNMKIEIKKFAIIVGGRIDEVLVN